MLELKKAKLQSLNEREITVLNFIMADKNIKAIDMAGSLNLAESTARNTLSAVFTKLGVPEDETDKRGYIVREYAEAYKDLYLKIGEPQIPSEGSTSSSDGPIPVPPEPAQASGTSPQLNVVPPNRRIRPIWIIVGILGGFLCIAVIVIAVLLNVIRNLNQDQGEPIVVADPTNTIEAPAIIPTQTLFVPVLVSTEIPTEIPTNIPSPTTPPPTDTPKPIPTLIPLPFSDSFDSGKKPEWEEATGNWRVINGLLTADASDNDNFIYVGDVMWTDYRVDVDVFNYDHNYPVYIVVRESPQGNMKLMLNCCNIEWLLNDEEIAVLEERGLTYSYFDGFAKNHVRIEVQGTLYTAYIDGKQVLQVDDDTLAHGRAGIGFYYSSDNTQRFDNFSIETLP